MFPRWALVGPNNDVTSWFDPSFLKLIHFVENHWSISLSHLCAIAVAALVLCRPVKLP